MHVKYVTAFSPLSNFYRLFSIGICFCTVEQNKKQFSDVSLFRMLPIAFVSFECYYNFYVFSTVILMCIWVVICARRLGATCWFRKKYVSCCCRSDFCWLFVNTWKYLIIDIRSEKKKKKSRTRNQFTFGIYWLQCLLDWLPTSRHRLTYCATIWNSVCTRATHSHVSRWNLFFSTFQMEINWLNSKCLLLPCVQNFVTTSTIQCLPFAIAPDNFALVIKNNDNGTQNRIRSGCEK